MIKTDHCWHEYPLYGKKPYPSEMSSCCKHVQSSVAFSEGLRKSVKKGSTGDCTFVVGQGGRLPGLVSGHYLNPFGPMDLLAPFIGFGQ